MSHETITCKISHKCESNHVSAKLSRVPIEFTLVIMSFECIFGILCVHAILYLARCVYLYLGLREYNIMHRKIHLNIIYSSGAPFKM